MKLNKSKNKGKVHPSPSPSSSSSTSNNNIINDPISSLNHLLPTAILTLISLLSLQDREVLAYMITHSLQSSSSSKKPTTKQQKPPTMSTSRGVHSGHRIGHNSPTFDCCCFVCFSSYWNMWNSSPNSDLIDQAIEAFEDHLSLSETPKINSNNNIVIVSADVEVRENHCVCLPEGDKEEGEVNSSNADDVEERECQVVPVAGKAEERESGVHQQQHKGLARKVLPDFIGFFQSRLWKRLWGPNV